MKQQLTIAVTPMRTQPLHLGHINLIKNLEKQFDRIRLIIGNQPQSQDNPFDFTQRLQWWKQAEAYYNIKNIEFRIGTHGLGIESMLSVYMEGYLEYNCVLISGNNQVIKDWQQRGFQVVNIHQIRLHKEISGIADSLITKRNDNGRLIREAMHNLANLAALQDYLPSFVYQDLISKFVEEQVS